MSTLVAFATAACGGRMEDPPSSSTLESTFTRDQLIPRLQEAICNSAERCCNAAGWMPLDDCREAVRMHWQPSIEHAQAIGAVFNAAEALRCVSQTRLEWAQCQDQKAISSRIDEVCATIFSAPAASSLPGQPCNYPMDCLRTNGSSVICLRVVQQTRFEGTCLVNLQSDLGGPCGGRLRTDYANCKAPFVCGADLLCRQPFLLGQYCSSLGSDTCGAGSVCESGNSNSCVAATAFGSACRSRSSCENYACNGEHCCVSPDLPLSWYCKAPLP